MNSGLFVRGTFVLVVIGIIVLLSNSSFTGKFVSQGSYNNVDVQKHFSSDTNFNFPIYEAGTIQLNSFKASGYFEGGGFARVVLVGNNMSYVVLDTRTYSPFLTGFLVSGVVSDNLKINDRQAAAIDDASEISQDSVPKPESKITYGEPLPRMNFSKACDETCLLPQGLNDKDYTVYIEVSNGTLYLDNIDYTIINFPGTNETNESNVAISFSIVDSNKQPVSGDVVFHEKGTNLVLQKISDGKFSTSSTGMIKVLDVVPSNDYSVDIIPASSPIKHMKIFGLDVFNDSTLTLGIDNLQNGTQQSYAIDPSNLSFSYAEVQVLAVGTGLYKCKDWNFSEQRCYGEWNKIMNILPGQEYTINLTSTDPAFAERNDSTNYLFNASDPQYTSYQQMKNVTVGGTLYSLSKTTANALECWTPKWIMPNSTYQQWYNGTWNFSVYTQAGSNKPTCYLFARIFKYNGTETEIINATNNDANACSSTGTTVLWTWNYSMSFGQNVNLSPGSRVGVQICLNVTGGGSSGRTMTLYWEGGSASHVEVPITNIVNDNVPNWSSQSQNTSTPQQGQAVKLSALWFDDVNLSYAVLSTNESGSWVNKTIYGSPLTFSGTINWSNFTWNNASVVLGTVVGWRVYANDSRNQWNVTDIMAFKVSDTAAPTWSSNSSSTPATYNASQPSVFNMTWTDNAAVSSVLIEGNWSGSAVNYTAVLISGTTSSGVWSYNATLPVGTYYWKSYANDTSGNTNASSNWIFTIAKANDFVNLSLNSVQNNVTITYGANLNASATSTSGTNQIYRNGTNVTAQENTNVILGAGYYAYKANTTGNSNYSVNGTGVTYYVTVNQATPTCSLSYTPASPITYGTQLNASCRCTNGTVAQLYRNGTNVTTEINTNVSLGAEAYNYTCNTTGNTNYTIATNSSIFVVNKAATLTRLFLNGTEGNKNYNRTQVANFTVTLNVSGKIVYLDTNISVWAQQSNVTPLVNITTLSVAGYYNITGSFPGDTNYSASSITYYANVNIPPNSAPTQSTPKLNFTSSSNLTTDNITCYNQSTADVDGDSVKNIYNWQKNGTSVLLLNLPFEGGSNSTWTKDYSGYGYSGSVENTLWNKTGGYDGKGAYEFNRTPGSNITTTLVQTAVSKYTIAAWIKTVSGQGVIVHDRGTGAGQSLTLSLGPSCGALGAYCTGSTSGTPAIGLDSNGVWVGLNANRTVNDGNWHFIVGIFDSTVGQAVSVSNFALYIDGVLANGPTGVIGTVPNSPLTGLGGTQIGYHAPWGYSFNGTIDDVVIYNFSLSAQQIAALYNNRTNIIVSQELFAGDNWSCSITPNDGYTDGSLAQSNNGIVLPSITLPQWSNSGQNNSAPTMFDTVKLYSFWSGSSTLSTAILSTNESGSWVNKSVYGSPSALGGTTSWSNFTWYNSTMRGNTVVGWRVYANNSAGYWNVTDIQTFVVQPTVSVTLVNNSVGFGLISPSIHYDTLTNSPYPFYIQNNGNIPVNVSISASQSLFTSSSLNTSSFQYAAGNSSHLGSFNWPLSQTTWYNMSATSRLDIAYLGYASSSNSAETDIALNIPQDEPIGYKNTTITFSVGES